MNTCSANDGATRAEIDELKVKINQLEKRLADTHLLHREEPAGCALDGFEIGAGVTIVGQSTIDANNANKEDVTDITYSIDLEIEKEFEGSGMAFIHLEGGAGGGLDGDELDLFSGVNRDAGNSSNSVQVTEAWYEHYFFDKRVILTFGKLDATCYLDDNEIANDECTQFLGFAFRNSTALEFPDDNSIGARLGINPIESFELNLGFIDDNADWEDVFKSPFIFGQINVKPNLFALEGNYRFYIWRDDSEHTELIDITRDEEANYGWGISVDQGIIKPATVFFRCGWENDKVSNIEWAWSTGLQINGEIWNRDEDVLGVAFGQNIPGDDYGKGGNPDHHESRFEAYYNLHINDYLSLSPDLQVILSPKGVASSDEGVDDTVYVIGLRVQIDL